MSARGSKRGTREWEQVLLTIAFGIIIVVAGGWNYVTALVGSAICIGSMLEIREIRIIFKVRLNRIVGTNIFQVQDSNITNSNLLGNVHGDVHIHNPSKLETTSDDSQKIERDFSIDEGEYQNIKVGLSKGQTLRGEVSADGEISIYLMSEGSLRSFDNGDNFNSYWKAENVLRSTFSYKATRTKPVCLIIDNDTDDETSVEVKLKVI